MIKGQHRTRLLRMRLLRFLGSPTRKSYTTCWARTHFGPWGDSKTSQLLWMQRRHATTSAIETLTHQQIHLVQAVSNTLLASATTEFDERWSRLEFSFIKQST